MLEACHIDELKGDLKYKNDQSNDNENMAANTSVSGLDRSHEKSRDIYELDECE
jgi:hypothetical protein